MPPWWKSMPLFRRHASALMLDVDGAKFPPHPSFTNSPDLSPLLKSPGESREIVKTGLAPLRSA
jgi:hypothetical protein